MTREAMLDLYHRTTPEAAAAILAAGRLVTRENTPEAFVSDRVDGQAAGYGTAVVQVRVRASRAELEDEFPDGERHFRIPLAGVQIVGAFTVGEDGVRVPLAAASRAASASFPGPPGAAGPMSSRAVPARAGGPVGCGRDRAVQR